MLLSLTRTSSRGGLHGMDLHQSTNLDAREYDEKLQDRGMVGTGIEKRHYHRLPRPWMSSVKRAESHSRLQTLPKKVSGQRTFLYVKMMDDQHTALSVASSRLIGRIIIKMLTAVCES